MCIKNIQKWCKKHNKQKEDKMKEEIREVRKNKVNPIKTKTKYKRKDTE